MGKTKSLNDSTSESNSTRPKRRKQSTMNQSSMNNTSIANYSNLTADLETNEIIGRLRGVDEAERLSCVTTLANLFADPESNVTDENPSLWADFMGRFCDVSRAVRLQMVQSCVDIYCNRPEFRHDIAEAIIQRARDPEEDVRQEVILAITGIVKHDYEFLTEQFLSVLRDRTLDKKYNVRHVALLTLASLYKRARVGQMQDELKRLSWVKNKVLHVYYQCGAEDRLLCEKLTYTSLVPYTIVDIDERMDVLFELYCTVDDNAAKAFNEIMKQQRSIRSQVRVILDLLSMEGAETEDDEIAVKIRSLADKFPNPSKTTEQLKAFFNYLAADRRAFDLIQYLVGDDFTTAQVQEAIKELFVKVGPGSKMKDLQSIARLLLERSAPVIIDGDGIKVLVEKSAAALDSSISIGNVPYEQLVDRAFSLLLVVSYSFPGGFRSEEVTRCLLTFLRHGDKSAADVGLEILSHCSGVHPNFFPGSVLDTVVSELSDTAINGTPKQAKYATICLSSVSQRLKVLDDLIQMAKPELNLGKWRVETALAIMTTIAVRAPADFKQGLMKVAISIVNGIILNDEFTASVDDGVEEWRPVDELAPHARAKIAAVKFLSRWVVGQKSNENDNATKAINLLSAIVDTNGDITRKRSGKLSYPEKAAMRLAAAQALLKILREKMFVGLMSMHQFRILAKVVVDDCRHVRERFATKLQTALLAMRLPLEFLAIFCYVPTLQPTSDEDDDKIMAFRRQIHAYIVENISRRREFLRKNPNFQCRPEEFLPEYYLSYVVHLLSYYDKLETYENSDALKEIRECLWFAMEPLLQRHSQQEIVDHQFLHKMFVDIKQTRNSEKPDDEEQNKKLWAICDLALVLLSSKVPNLVMKDLTYQSILSRKWFTSPMKHQSNTEVYLPQQFLRNKNFEKSFNKSVN